MGYEGNGTPILFPDFVPQADVSNRRALADGNTGIGVPLRGWRLLGPEFEGGHSMPWDGHARRRHCTERISHRLLPSQPGPSRHSPPEHCRRKSKGRIVARSSADGSSQCGCSTQNDRTTSGQLAASRRPVPLLYPPDLSILLIDSLRAVRVCLRPPVDKDSFPR